MSIHFHPLRIKEVKKETPECVSVLFEIPEELKNTFQFSQGQSLTMRTFLNNEEVRRTYSICSSPLDDEWRVAIKKQEAGTFSTFANEKLKPGDILEVMEPVGKFYTELDPQQKKNYVAFAAGSGITPVISLIKTTLRTEPFSAFTLVYGNRNKNSIIFKEDLEGLKDKFIDRLCIIHILSRERTETPVNSGKIGLNKLNELSRLIRYETIDEFFICGPEEMIFSVKEFLEQKNINEKKIHFELFTSAGSRKPAFKTTKPVEDSSLKSKITIKMDGRSIDFDLALDSDVPILDAALKQGADLPFACKGGMCCTCKARLLEGEVEMDVHWGLEHEEIEKGYILTCQSHPKTEKVVIDFDIK
ncbi:MAG: phenylacetate-CoA oxygenase/reductase subunit PaaK [Chitinophagaceae bacterium]|nr:MAG: phenylacetate-CoA oxygenase/reductase subunit PaaK [Chitinophagaceae bacterium]